MFTWKKHELERESHSPENNRDNRHRLADSEPENDRNSVKAERSSRQQVFREHELVGPNRSTQHQFIPESVSANDRMITEKLPRARGVAGTSRSREHQLPRKVMSPSVQDYAKEGSSNQRYRLIQIDDEQYEPLKKKSLRK